MSAHLAHIVPNLLKLLEHEKILDALWSFTEGRSELIRDKKNSIWSFIIRNSYRPAMLKEQFDIIIGNPPWLSYRYIADPEYQAEIKRRAVERYAIAPKSQKLFTQMELAVVFLAHSIATFARPGARLGFVMPRSILSADQHQRLIRRQYLAPMRLTSYWDMWEVKPLFNVPSCVLFATRDNLRGSSNDALPVETLSGTLPERDLPWSAAKPKLVAERAEAHVVYLGSRCALSIDGGTRTPGRAGAYSKIFKQGATIVPRSVYFVLVRDLNGEPNPDAQYWCETDPVQSAAAKPPYDEVRLSGLVEGRFLFKTAISRHVLPFCVLEPSDVVLPLDVNENTLYLRTAAQLTRNGFREIGKWMAKAEHVWKEKRKEKAGKQTLYEWLDYQGKLSAQLLSQRHLVLYNAAGTNVSAAYFDRRMYPRFVVEHKLYWAAFSNRAEAHYVTSILNSKRANRAIKPFQSTGLLGERDIEKKLLDLPIPSYDSDNLAHEALARLGEQAHQQAQIAVGLTDFPVSGSLARQRGFIRESLATTISEIDDIVLKIL